MQTLNSNIALFDISSLIQVQQYTLLANAEINIRVNLGDAANEIAGNGLYQIRYDIDGRTRDDYNDIPSGVTKTVLQSSKLTVFAGEVVTVYIKGVTADTDVRVESYIIDVTPSLTSFSGAIGSESVWTEKEKKSIIKSVNTIRKDVKELLGKPDNRADIQEVKSRLSSLLERTDNVGEIKFITEQLEKLLKVPDNVDEIRMVKEQLRALIHSKDLTNIENKVNLLLKDIKNNRNEVLNVRLELKKIIKEMPVTVNENNLIKRIVEALNKTEVEIIESEEIEEGVVIANNIPESIQ